MMESEAALRAAEMVAPGLPWVGVEGDDAGGGAYAGATVPVGESGEQCATVGIWTDGGMWSAAYWQQSDGLPRAAADVRVDGAANAPEAWASLLALLVNCASVDAALMLYGAAPPTAVGAGGVWADVRVLLPDASS